MKSVLKRQIVDGILLLDKPQDITSNAALQRVKRLFNAKKAGHTGSLDPLATGMLPICFGEATKISQFLLDSDKYYKVHVILGKRTTTGDAEGEIVETRTVPAISQKMLSELFQDFTGCISQVPPMYSALKHKGQPLYKLARKGIEVPRKPRQISIHSIKLLELSENSFDILVHCSKGTYIRTLVEDIGAKIGSGAYVGGLRRTAVVPYQDERMYSLDELDAFFLEDGTHNLQTSLLPVDSSLKSITAVYLSSVSSFYIKTGQAVRIPNSPISGLVRLYDDKNNFIGIGEIIDDGRVAPKRLLSTA